MPFLLVILLNISNLVAEKQITDNDFRKFVADDFCKEFEAEMAKNANFRLDYEAPESDGQLVLWQ